MTAHGLSKTLGVSQRTSIAFVTALAIIVPLLNGALNTNSQDSERLAERISRQQIYAEAVEAELLGGRARSSERLQKNLVEWEKNSDWLSLQLSAHAPHRLPAFRETESDRTQLYSKARDAIGGLSSDPISPEQIRSLTDKYSGDVIALHLAQDEEIQSLGARAQTLLWACMGLLVAFTLWGSVIVMNRIKSEFNALIDKLESANDNLEQQNTEIRLQSEALEEAIERADRATELQELARTRFETLFAAIPVPCITIDRTGMIIEWNTLAEETWELDPSIAAFRDLSEAFTCPPLGPGELDKLMSGYPVQVGVRRIRTDVAGIWAQLSAQPLRSRDGEIVGAVLACTDISERIERDKQIALLSSVVQHSRNGVLITDENERIVFCNEAFTEISGYCREEILGQRPSNLLQGPETSPETRGRVREAIDKRVSITTDILNYHKNGQTYWQHLTISPILDDEGNLLHYVAIGDDVTLKRQREAELKDRERLFRNVTESLREGVVVHDQTGAIIMANEAAQEILGLNEDQLRGRTSMDPNWRVVGPDLEPLPGSEHAAMRTLRTGKAVSDERMGVYRADGGLRWLAVNSVPVMAEDGSPWLVVASFVDNTNLIAQQDLLEEQMQVIQDKTVELEEQQGQLQLANRRLASLAMQDGLTGVGNRRAFDERLKKTDLIAKRSGATYCVILLDIDHFKQFNDTFGHQAGDEVLIQVGALVGGQARSGDFVARYGGEEFVIVLPATTLADAEGVAEQVRQTIEGGDWPLRQITASIGVATWHEGLEGTQVLEQADQALYRSKQGGRNRVTLAEAPVHSEAA